MIKIFYIFIMLICLSFILLNTKKLFNNLNRLQDVYFKWITKFRAATFAGKIEILASIVFFAVIIYWLLFERKENYGYAALFFFLLTFINYPKWFVAFGKKGIIIDNDFIAWEEIKKWEIDNDNNVLQIFYGPEYSKKKIAMIHKFRKDCEKLLSQNNR